jgi:hypothetical protein
MLILSRSALPLSSMEFTDFGKAFHFATLVGNFQTLRSTGFDHDPPFVLEPDFTGTNVAWVVGIDIRTCTFRRITSTWTGKA